MDSEMVRRPAPRPEVLVESVLDDLYRRATRDGTLGPLKLREWVDLAETWRITTALREHRGNRSAAARALGIGRRTLYSKMERLGIEPTWGLTAPGGAPR